MRRPIWLANKIKTLPKTVLNGPFLRLSAENKVAAGQTFSRSIEYRFPQFIQRGFSVENRPAGNFY
jgi:hypothetical protein